MTKKMKYIVSIFVITFFCNSCGNSSECIDWQEYHEDIDFYDLDFSVHSNIEKIMDDGSGDEEIIDGLSFKPIYIIKLPSIISNSLGWVSQRDIIYDSNFKYILRKDGDLFTGCIEDYKRGSYYKFENGLLISWEEYMLREDRTQTDTLLHKMQFKNGLPHGKWFTKHAEYNRNGKLEAVIPKEEGEFLNGKRHGKWKRYDIYRNELNTTIDYDNGKYHGEITYIDYQSARSTVLTTKRYYQNGLVTKKEWGSFVKDERAKKVKDKRGNIVQETNDSLYLNEVNVYKWNPNWYYDFGYHIRGKWEKLGFKGGTWEVLAHLYQYASINSNGTDNNTLIFRDFPAGEIITRDKYFTDHTKYDREHLSKMVDPKLLYLAK